MVHSQDGLGFFSRYWRLPPDINFSSFLFLKLLILNFRLVFDSFWPVSDPGSFIQGCFVTRTSANFPICLSSGYALKYLSYVFQKCHVFGLWSTSDSFQSSQSQHFPVWASARHHKKTVKLENHHVATWFDTSDRMSIDVLELSDSTGRIWTTAFWGNSEISWSLAASKSGSSYCKQNPWSSWSWSIRIWISALTEAAQDIVLADVLWEEEATVAS